MFCELIQIDFNSDEAIYIQLRNQIILGIATSQLQEGDTLPSVRQMAETIGINMHTVNKHTAFCARKGFCVSTAAGERLSGLMPTSCMRWKNCRKNCG